MRLGSCCDSNGDLMQRGRVRQQRGRRVWIRGHVITCALGPLSAADPEQGPKGPQTKRRGTTGQKRKKNLFLPPKKKKRRNCTPPSSIRSGRRGLSNTNQRLSQEHTPFPNPPFCLFPIDRLDDRSRPSFSLQRI